MSVKAIIQEAINRSPMSLKETLEEELRNRMAEAVLNKMEEISEADKSVYHYYVTNNKGDSKSDWTVTHSKKKPFTAARDAVDHIMRSGGRQGGTVHTVNAKTGNIIQARSYDSGQAGYPRDPGVGDPRNVRDLREEIEQIDEISSGKLGRYIKKASTDIANKEIQRSKLRDQGSKHTFHDQDAENALGDDDEARMALRKARWAAADAMYDKERKLGDKQYKRETGVYTAIKKLSKRD